MKALLGAALLALATVAMVAAEDTKLGAGVSLKEATPIAALHRQRRPDYVGKTVRIDGVATAVCEEMGCWMAVARQTTPRARRCA